jgi:hypothetical protein
LKVARVVLASAKLLLKKGQFEVGVTVAMGLVAWVREEVHLSGFHLSQIEAHLGLLDSPEEGFKRTRSFQKT